ncbi:MAG TPA: FAD-dependent oxidoreductase [Chthonomonadaceae bacterium]|nr:FAD-dependent oxidoreductase [Chthonomonadaceae bacterium]
MSDILIVGGGTGGTAAALAAAEAGANVCLLEETGWLGGQLTTQGVCTPDEQAHIETFGGTRRYVRFREAARNHYRTHFRLAAEAAAQPYFNPGNCWVSRLSFEPKVGAAILREMAQPLVEEGRLQIYFQTRAVACARKGDRITAVVTRDAAGVETRFTPQYVLDATDLGDVLALCGTEGEDWVVGAESRAQTGEPDAPETARPDWVQPFTFPFALDWSPETAATNVISPPPDYEALKALQQYGVLCGAITGLFVGVMPWWTYRRVLAAENFDDPRIPADLAMINTAGNDFYGGNLIGAGAGRPEAVAETLARARHASLGYVYWLQTECPREDDPTGRKCGYPEFRLRADVFDTPDGCAIRPYIRESRRIRSLRPILEQEIVAKDFSGNACQTGARAAFMPDTVGIGHYALDIHPNGHGEPSAYVPTRPFQIPLGALIPTQLENLLPACKNIGTTHLTNGAYRLHPIEWNIGESAGLLAVYCLEQGRAPREVPADPQRLRAFQARLLRAGIPLHWYIDIPLEHPAFAAVQTLASTGHPLGSDADLLFHPEAPIAPEDWRAWRAAAGNASAPSEFTGTRAEAARVLAPGR